MSIFKSRRSEFREFFFVVYHLYPFSYQLFQFSGSVLSDFLLPHGLQHARLPCPSPTPGVCTNSGPLSR